MELVVVTGYKKYKGYGACGVYKLYKGYGAGGVYTSIYKKGIERVTKSIKDMEPVVFTTL